MQDLNIEITVIIPVYNVEKYVKNCVESLIQQSFEGVYEIILVDDGSTDSSGEICDSIAARNRIVDAYHKENGGLSDARNFGVEKAKGKYVTFVDSDDIVSRDYLKELFTGIIKFNADICAVKRIELDSQEDATENLQQSISSSFEILSTDDAVSQVLIGDKLDVSACAKLARRDVWILHPFPLGRVYEDLATTINIYLDSNITAISEKKMYGQVCRPGSITRSSMSNKQLMDHWYAIEDCYNSAISNGNPDVVKIALAMKMLEYARLKRSFSRIENPSTTSLKIYNTSTEYMKRHYFEYMLLDRVPLNHKIKVTLSIISQKLYNIAFDIAH